MESSEEGKDGAELGELTESCISGILSFTTAKDVCSLSAVSTTWKSAADADSVWEKMINQRFGDNISQAISPLGFPSKKHLYISLSRDHRTQRVWLDEFTGKIGCMISAKDLWISWGETPKYWEWVCRDDSRFGQLARLRQVWWLFLWRRFECSILSPNTHYTVSFIIKVDKNRAKHRSPIIFSIIAPDGVYTESARFFDNLERSVEKHGQGFSMTPLSHDDNGWTKFLAGEFYLEEDRESEGVKHVDFVMKNIDCSFIKSGIWLDGVKIEPKH